MLQGALDAAHKNTKVPGSATACVMQVDQANGTLVAANLVSAVPVQSFFLHRMTLGPGAYSRGGCFLGSTAGMCII